MNGDKNQLITDVMDTPMEPNALTENQILKLIVATGDKTSLFLLDYCCNKLSHLETVYEIVKYCLPDVGLRFRPFMLRISYGAGKGSFDNIIEIAAGIELVQISTLVIDDVLDNSSLRNGELSVCKKWGMKQAITLGTIMSSTGLNLVAEGLVRNHVLKNRLDVLQLLEQTHSEIYVGQFIDLEFEGNIDMSEQQYIEMISKTTACFIQAPLVAGAMLWDAPPVLISQLKRIGYNLGMAYQIRDDVIDLLGDTELTGKPKAIDVYDRKMRLPMIQALRCIDSVSRSRLLELLESKENLTTKEVEEVLDLFKQAGSIKYSINKTKEYCLKADELVDTLDSEFDIMKNHLHGVSKLISYFGDEWD